MKDSIRDSLNKIGLRLTIAQQIVKWEARYNKLGEIRLYPLPEADGGGLYEYAGINDRYHPDALLTIRRHLTGGRHATAESYATGYIANYTDVVQLWNPVPAVEAFLRDCAFNRGPKGALRIMQIALGVADDGKFGPITKAALKKAQKSPEDFLRSLRSARESYERRVAPPTGKRAKLWKGLVNRWDKAFAFAMEFI